MSNFFVGAIPVDLVTGAILKQGQGGNAEKIGARAEDGIVIINAVEAFLSGDAVTFVNDLTNLVISGKTLSPDETLAIQNAILLAQGPAVIEKLKSGTLLGQAEVAIATNVLEEARKVCNEFIAAAPPASSTTAATESGAAQ